MRSLLVIGAIAVVVGTIALRGFLPRRASARASSSRPGIELAYTEYDQEQSLPFVPRTRPDAPPPRNASRSDLDPAPDKPTPATESGSDGGARTAEPESDQPALVANAGPDQNVWLGGNELRLDGTRSFGRGLSYSWRQIGGPNDLRIKDASAPITTATGFPLDTLDAVSYTHLTLPTIYSV